MEFFTRRFYILFVTIIIIIVIIIIIIIIIILFYQYRERNVFRFSAAVCGEERCVTTQRTAIDYL